MGTGRHPGGDLSVVTSTGTIGRGSGGVKISVGVSDGYRDTC